MHKRTHQKMVPGSQQETGCLLLPQLQKLQPLRAHAIEQRLHERMRQYVAGQVVRMQVQVALGSNCGLERPTSTG